jgi:isopenicillin-N epimerase
MLDALSIHRSIVQRQGDIECVRAVWHTARMNFKSFRAHWSLDPAVTFLNHGSFGACPRAVMQAQQELRDRMEANPVRFLARELTPLLDASRARLATLLHTAPQNLVFVPNATTAVNAVVRSLDFRRGDEILTTNHDYNACRNALKEAARRAGARVVIATPPFPLDNDDQIIAAVLARVTKRTRLAMLDHITSSTALVFPIKRLVRELESRGIDCLVDGAHAPGMVPLDLDALRPAYYTGNCHKWLCAPKGAAFLYARPNRQKHLLPTTVSHGYDKPWPDRCLFHTRFDWVGTIDPTPWLCIADAIAFCESLLPGGLPALMKRNHQLAVEARRLLCKALDIKPPCPEEMLGAMATLPLPAAPAGDSDPLYRLDPLHVALYEKHKIEVPVMRWGKPKRRWFRISAQAYNNLADYERLAAALSAEIPA